MNPHQAIVVFIGTQKQLKAPRTLIESLHYCFTIMLCFSSSILVVLGYGEKTLMRETLITTRCPLQLWLEEGGGHRPHTFIRYKEWDCKEYGNKWWSITPSHPFIHISCIKHRYNLWLNRGSFLTVNQNQCYSTATRTSWQDNIYTSYLGYRWRAGTGLLKILDI